MADETPSGLTREAVNAWLVNLEKYDPQLAASMKKTMPKAQPALEGLGVAMSPRAIALETMVRRGRPVLPVKANAIAREPSFIEPPGGEIMVERLLAAADAINPVLPLVGRIEVANFPTPISHLGTGWLVEPDVVVTNRHVATLIGRRDGRTYKFLPGRFGDVMNSSVNWKREMDSQDSAPSAVERIIYIEEDPTKADIAFLKIAPVGSGLRQNRVELAEEDAKPGTDVVVIGYPARAFADVIPDQEWMEKVFGGRYDVKRASPGMMTPDSRGWAAHDCTTLGGNSGGAVLRLTDGKAVALHFAGAYMLENYAVPASTIRRYIRERPWDHEAVTVIGDSSGAGSGVVAGTGGGSTNVGVVQQTASASPAVPSGPAVSVTIPLTISVSLGTPVPGVTLTTTAGPDVVVVSHETAPINEAVRRFAEEFRGDGILSVRSGLIIANGRFTKTPCIHVVTEPTKFPAVRTRCPKTYLGHVVDVRAAQIVEMVRGQDIVSEAAVTTIAYNDGDRTGPNFALTPIEESMELTCHVGPERSWAVLSKYIASAKGQMVSSMYEFHAEHIAEAIEARLQDDIKMRLVLDNATRTNKNGPGEGDFDRNKTFPKWAEKFEFERIYVPEGPSGLVANAYHIKVTVDDADRIWLSSGNWKNSSQPNIPDENLNKPSKMKGNREWHVVARSKTLATRYRNHILADLKFSHDNGGSEEAAALDLFVDVPIALEEAVELEAKAPKKVLEPLEVNRAVKVQPLLTPDKRGKIYTDAVLDLIESAEEQLLFQIPYIDSYKPAAAGNLDKLVTALIKKSKEIDDVRIILRSDHGTWIPCAEDLQKRGLDLDRCFKHLPSTHTKGMIADGRRVLVGSHNWSGGGVTLNRDASLLFDDREIAEYYREAFLMDWARASAPVIPESAVTEAPRIADPAIPVPPGFRRMSLEEFLEG